MAFWLSLKGAPAFELVPGKDVTIGRGRNCDLSVYSSLLSREHARVRWEGEKPVLFDLESLNGIFIGPDRIHRHELHDGDVVRLGDVQLYFKEADTAPPLETESGFTPHEAYHLEQTPADCEPGSETRFFSRTAALHQRVFEYDELLWLLDQVEKRRDLIAVIRSPDLREGTSVVAWSDALPDPKAFWECLYLGVIAPRDWRQNPPAEIGQFAKHCYLTKRGERLQLALKGGKAHWNEMAALRYKVRQGKIFKPLRMAARAYRPGGGLRELTLERLRYELLNIYAAELEPDQLELELRRLLCLGFLAPKEGVGPAAWFPEDWTDTGVIQIARRGYAMLEGFRLEEV